MNTIEFYQRTFIQPQYLYTLLNTYSGVQVDVNITGYYFQVTPKLTLQLQTISTMEMGTFISL